MAVNVDRISELPESILHHILSFLSHKQAIQTSALSKSWRHVGPTGPRIELRESFFKSCGGKPSLLSNLTNTLQTYNNRNLSVHEFIFQMSDVIIHDSESISVVLDKAIPMVLTNTGLKKFNFSVPHYVASPSVVFRAEFLTELYLTECKFMSTTTDDDHDKPLFVGLKTLSLNHVNILDETLEKIMCSCPLIERVLLSRCVGLTNIQLNKSHNNNLKHFSCCFEKDEVGRTQSIEIDAPTIETIRLLYCHNWYGQDKHFFPCLKSLYLLSVRLSAELFESFSSNFPSLEELELDACYGFEEIQLTVCSIKRLVLTICSARPTKATIYAPNIHYFEISAHFPPQLIFYTETPREWKSHVVMLCDTCSQDDNVSTLPWLLQLSQLLNSLSESQISLDVFPNSFKNLKVEETNDAGFCKPVPLERVHVNGRVTGGNWFSSFPDFFICLFLICRPRYICMNWYTTDSKNKLAEFIIFKIIRNQSWGHLWERDLEEISMQVWDENNVGWHTVRVEGASFPVSTSSDTKIMFLVKWRD